MHYSGARPFASRRSTFSRKTDLETDRHTTVINTAPFARVALRRVAGLSPFARKR
jgi:hypothetical protein